MPPSVAATVNDLHSKLNSTQVCRIETPTTLAEIRAVLERARHDGLAVSLSGGRHAMGGQQFLTGGVLLDTRGLNRVLHFDAECGLIEVEAGIQWPALIRWLLEHQQGRERQWGIVQKQTGADDLCLGGSLSANIHSRGLKMQPIVQDVEAFTLLTADGELRKCSRSENRDLFALAIGGYGLFGVIYSVCCASSRGTRLSGWSK